MCATCETWCSQCFCFAGLIHFACSYSPTSVPYVRSSCSSSASSITPLRPLSYPPAHAITPPPANLTPTPNIPTTPPLYLEARTSTGTTRPTFRKRSTTPPPSLPSPRTKTPRADLTPVTPPSCANSLTVSASKRPASLNDFSTPEFAKAMGEYMYNSQVANHTQLTNIGTSLSELTTSSRHAARSQISFNPHTNQRRPADSPPRPPANPPWQAPGVSGVQSNAIRGPISWSVT
ncbi:hypothetical protein QAD02_008390 [Eretmocerus hayati]|uniref:Uncharacterized protein n=1 Tax=Eretmocerus hayati TaxID=131215 RepID=A0ACC2N6C7_9HYME|nr:hypothetical protein QAD02_008390 [Eretmocerus hayati]